MACSCFVSQRIFRAVFLVSTAGLSLFSLWHQRYLGTSNPAFQESLSRIVVAEEWDASITNVSSVLSAKVSSVNSTNESSAMAPNVSSVLPTNVSFAMGANVSSVMATNVSSVIPTNVSFAMAPNVSSLMAPNVSSVIRTNASFAMAANASSVMATNVSSVIPINASSVMSTNVSSIVSSPTNTTSGAFPDPYQRLVSPRTAMVIAVFPNTWVRLSTLWTQLECFSSKFDMIIVAAPDWSRDIVEPVLQLAINTIPGLDKKDILSRYFVNDRYDVGLWCDSFLVNNNQSTYGFQWHPRQSENQDHADDMALSSLLSNESSLEHVVLINDSVWALERSTEVLDLLRGNQTLQMVSLSYSKLGNESLVPHGFWLESVQRAFTKDALKVFLDAKCVPASHPYYCPERVLAWRRKRCIVDNFEIRVSKLYPLGTVMGVYPSDVPPHLLDPKRLHVGGIKTWVGNLDYWVHLRKTTKFPLAKASSADQLQEAKRRRPKDFLKCSKYMASLLSLNLTFPEPVETR